MSRIREVPAGRQLAIVEIRVFISIPFPTEQKRKGEGSKKGGGGCGNGVSVLKVVDLEDVVHEERCNAFLRIESDEAVAVTDADGIRWSIKPLRRIELAI